MADATQTTNDTAIAPIDVGDPTILAALYASEISYGTYDLAGFVTDTPDDSSSSGSFIQAGWTEITGIQSETDDTTHYQGAAFYKLNAATGITEVIIANRGTQFDRSSGAPYFGLYDYVVSDASLAVGITPQADNSAKVYYQAIVTWLLDPTNGIQGSINIIETGHSLGGQEADYVDATAANSPLTLIPTEAVTFDAPGLPSNLIVAGQNYNALNISASEDFVHVGGSLLNGGYAGSSVTVQVGEPLVPWETLTAVSFLGGAPFAALISIANFAYTGLYTNHLLGNIWTYHLQHPALGGVNVQTYAPSKVSQPIVRALENNDSYGSMTAAQRQEYFATIFNGSSSSPQAATSIPAETFTQSTNSDGVSLTGSLGDQLTTSQSGAVLTVSDGINDQDQLTFSADGTTIRSDSWSTRTGTTGNDTFSADGSAEGKMTYSGGGYATYFDDGEGDMSTDYYTTSGNLYASSWVHSDGSSGTYNYFPDGQTSEPSTGLSPGSLYATFVNPDGSYTIRSLDVQSVAQMGEFDASGSLKSQVTSAATGTDTGQTQNWSSSDGSYGSVTNHSAANSTGKTTNSDGSVETFSTNSGTGANEQTHTTVESWLGSSTHDVTIGHLDSSGSLVSDKWSLRDGASGQDSFSSNGSGNGEITHANGDSSTVTLDGTGGVTIDNHGDSGNELSQDWWKTDGTHGETLYTNGSISTTYLYKTSGQVVVTDFTPDGSIASKQTTTAGALFNPDGSNFGKIVNADGSYSVNYNDSNGDALVFQYTASGQLTGTNHLETDNSNAIGNNVGTWTPGLTSPYNAFTPVITDSDGTKFTIYQDSSQTETGQNWVASDGSHGTDIFNADSSSEGYQYNTDGSSKYYEDDGQGDITDTFYDANSIETGDAWQNADGSHGSDLYNADGSFSYITVAVDGTSNVLSQDAAGNYASIDFNASNVKLDDNYVNADGKFGDDTFAANGSSSGEGFAANGLLIDRYTDDGVGNKTTNLYDGTGNSASNINGDIWTHSDGSSGSDTKGQLAFVQGYLEFGNSRNADGSTSQYTTSISGYTSTSNYSVTGALTSTSWSAADGTHGSKVYGAGGATSVSIYAADGSHSVTANDGRSDITTTQYGANGIAQSDTWSRLDGTSGSDTFNADGSSSGTRRNRDNTYATFVTTTLGVTTTQDFDYSGNLTGTQVSSVGADGNAVGTNYDANGTFVSSFVTITTTTGVTTTTYAGPNGTGAKLSDQWSTTSGTSGSDVYDSSGNTIESSVSDGHGDTSITLFGTASESVTGDNLTDTITANSGNDTLVAGEGTTTMNSGNPGGTGAGSTTFALHNASGLITINAGAKDILDLNGTTIQAVSYANGAWTMASSIGLPMAKIVGPMGYFSLDGKTTMSFAAAMAALSSGQVLSTSGGGYGESSAVSTTLLPLLTALNSTGLALTGSHVVGTANALDCSLTAVGDQDTLVGGVGNDQLNMSVLTNVAGTYDGVMVGGTGATTFNLKNNFDRTGTIEILTNAKDTLNVSVGSSDQGHILEEVTGTQLLSNGSIMVHLGGVVNVDVVIGTSGSYLNKIVNHVQGLFDQTTTLDQLLQQDGALQAVSATTVTLPYNVVQMALTGSANIAATGNTLDDIITANSGNDTLIAGIASDTLVAGAGSDSMVGGAGTDVMLAGSGSDTMVAGTGADTFTPSSGHVTIVGAKSNDTIDFGDIPVADVSATSTTSGGVTTVTLTSSLGGSVAVVGGSLGAVSFGSSGAVSLAQLQGTSQTVFSETGGTLAAGVSHYTLTGSANLSATGNALNDLITANSGNDVLTAGTGIDTLVGGAGNDTLVSGTARAVLIGGSGTTTFVVNNAADVISEPVNSNHNVEMTSVSVTLATNVQSLVGTGTAALTLTGNSQADVITANSGVDVLIAGSGPSTLIGGSGSDTLHGGSGSTLLIAGSGYTELIAGTGPTTMMAGANSGSVSFVVNNASDVIQAAAGATDFLEYASVSTTIASNLTYIQGIGAAAIVLTGNGAAHNEIWANSGDDTLISGSGVTDFVGESGRDVFIVNNSADTIYMDTTSTNSGANVEESSVSIVLADNVQSLVGLGNGAITLTGNSTNDDIITANSGADTLIGGGGNDTLVAGSGVDLLIGGTGNDVFVINSALDVVEEAANTGSNTEQTSVSTVLAANVQNLTGLGAGNLLLTGNSLVGTITANSGNDTLVAGGAATTLVGGVGTDLLIGNAARGSVAATVFNLHGAGGNATIQGSGADDSLVLSDVSPSMVTVTTAIGTVNGVTGQTIVTIQVVGGRTITLDAPAFSSVTFADGSSSTFASLTSQGAQTTSSAVSTTLGAGMTRLILTGSGNIVGTGNNLADSLFANSGNDTLIAGTGVATMYGGSGNDVFVVNSAADVIVESANSGSNIEQTSVSNTLAANVQQLLGTGSVALVLTGATTPGIVTANSGADTLVAGTGVTTLVGGAAGDTFKVNSDTDVVLGVAGTHNVELATSSVTAGMNVQVLTDVGQQSITLTGNTLNDLITGGTSRDKLIAGSGTDTLVGGSGGSDMIGGSGNDVYVLGTANDTITVGATPGNGTEQTAFSTTLANGVQYLVATGSGNLMLYGNDSNVNNVITANSGNDTIVAGSATTTMVAGAGSNVFFGYSGTRPNGTVTTYDYSIGNGVTNISGTQSNDILQFGAGISATSITATSQSSTVNGIPVTTVTLKVTGGTSVVLHSPTFTQVNFADGTSTTLAALLAGGNTMTSAVSATLAAGYTRLVLTGNANITGTGNNLADTIIANSGNDTLIAGTGLATLIGGSGNDVFVVNNASDVITEAANTGNNTEQTSVSVTLAANVQNLTGTGTGALTLTGNTLNNVITANSGADKLVAGSGLDTLVSGTGTDTLVGGAADNVFVINNAADVITKAANTGNNTEQTSVSLTLAANVQNLTGIGTAALTLTGNSLNNVITANSGADRLVAGSGLDTLVSGTGVDTLVGGAANNVFIINNAADVITEAANTGNNIEQSSVSVTLAANVQKLTGIGSAAIQLTGNTLNNVITANSANDTLVAGSGVATLVGGAGNDIFVINNTSDVIAEAANTGNNTEQSSVSTTLAANVQNLTGIGSAALTLTGNTLNNVITANSGADKLVAGSGLDTLVSGTGIDTLVGGAGNDVFVVNNASDVITKAANSGSNTEQSSVSVTLAANVQNLTGLGTTALTLTGNTLTNVITANSGADTLVAGSGLATLIGGAGNDVFVINNASDIITKAANTGANTEQSSVSVTLAANIQNLTGTGTAALTLTGNTLNNVITANSGADTLVSGTGIDTLIGGAGNDVFVVNNASDVITKATNTGSNVEQSSVSVTLAANVQKLTGIGSASIQLTGNTTADTITANSGNDTLIAGTGVATLIGGSGNDVFVVNNASDVITEAANTGNNTEQTSVSVTLAANVQNLTGSGTGALTLTGNTLNNVITANSGADKLVAGSGLDTLVSGTGIDTLVGGAANNVFVINNASDVITKAANTGSNTEQTSVSLTLAANVQNLTGIGTAAIKLTGNTLNDVITANSGADTLVAGSGSDTIVGGAGNYTVSIGAESDTVTLGDGNDTLVSAEAAANVETFQLGNGSDQITLGSGTDHVALGNGIDTIATKAGTDTLTLGTGQYTLTNTGAVENIVLTTGAENQLWFAHVGNNLQINVLGSSEQITVANWFTTGTKLNQLTSSDGHTINAAGIGQLVQAMASFGIPPAGQTSYTSQEQTALAPVMAANWH